MSNVADIDPGEFPNQFLGLKIVNNPVTSNPENLMEAPLKLNSELATGGVSGGPSFHGGTGSPQNVVAAGAGSFYFRTDTPSTSMQRVYVCTASGVTPGGAVWTAIL